MPPRKRKKQEKDIPVDLFLNIPTAEHWKKINYSPRFGTLIPLAALRTRRNQGVGDFADIPIFKEFSKKIGSSIIQVLPINDMGRSKVPYSSISAFALDPLYIAIDQVQEFLEHRSTGINAYLQENWHIVEEERRSRLMNIDRIRAFKFGALYKLYWDFIDRNRNHGTPRWQAFRSYCYSNAYWLDDYAIFRHLKNHFNWASWQEWPEEYRDRKPDALRLLMKERGDEINYFKYIQFVAYEQLVQAHNECRKENVLIKGDIPLLVDFESADVWAHPEYFNLEVCSGAPPDYYSKMGQNWGSPTYNWDKLGTDNYIWWRKRLEYSTHFFDIYRIDHIVGIFRIWTIPITPEFPRGTPSGWNAFYDPEDNGIGIHKPVWENHGRTLLNMMIDSTEMLPIGEDLGTIPYVCRHVMKNIGIPGYKVIIWERDFQEPGSPFFKPEEYDYISMATTTTHDFWSMPGYYENRDSDPNRAQVEENDMKGLWKFLMGEKPFQPKYTDAFHKTLLDRLFNSNSVFLIMPFTDLWGKVPGIYGDDAQLDRINDPGNPHRPENWVVKFPLDLEDFENEPKLAELMNYINELSDSSGRLPEDGKLVEVAEVRKD